MHHIFLPKCNKTTLFYASVLPIEPMPNSHMLKKAKVTSRIATSAPRLTGIATAAPVNRGGAAELEVPLLGIAIVV